MNKRSIISAVALLFTLEATAQVTSGTVQYEETVQMNMRVDGEAAQFAHLLPKEHKMRHVLHFTQDASLFQPVEQKPQAEEESAESGGGRRMRMVMNMPGDKIYTSFRDGKSVAQRDFMGRKFLVSGVVVKGQWKMTGKQRTVLNYPCQEAVMIKDKDTVTAWFTTAIPVSSGPHGWTGLPGLILAAQRNSNINITATSVTAGPLADGLLVQPKGGKKVSGQEYQAIVDEKLKEMGAQRGEGDQVIIRVRER